MIKLGWVAQAPAMSSAQNMGPLQMMAGAKSGRRAKRLFFALGLLTVLTFKEDRWHTSLTFAYTGHQRGRAEGQGQIQGKFAAEPVFQDILDNPGAWRDLGADKASGIRSDRITSPRSSFGSSRHKAAFKAPRLPAQRWPRPARQRIAEVVKLKIDLARHKTMDRSLAEQICKNTDKSNYCGKTYEAIVAEYIAAHAKANPEDPATGFVKLSYRPDPLGKRLQEEGLLAGSRLYAGPADPLSLPSDLNDVLTDKFYMNMDDSKAHPSYMRALTKLPEGKEVLDAYLSDPMSMLHSVAAHYFGDVTKEGLKNAKTLFLRLGMDGSILSWRKDHRVPHALKEHPFVESYATVMPSLTDEFAELPLARRALEIIQLEFPSREFPKRTWKSFLLQEIEFVARRAKVRVAVEKYDGYGALEHDGIRLFRGSKLQAVEIKALEKEMSDAVTNEVYEFVKEKYNRRGPPHPIQVKVKPASPVSSIQTRIRPPSAGPSPRKTTLVRAHSVAKQSHDSKVSKRTYQQSPLRQIYQQRLRKQRAKRVYNSRKSEPCLF
mmetsp:Transcript_99643/g.177381  ORF Transcript_99643/g.177381 Transcript_99643/m.177381 type:complete len:548 (+) Transcript_99643:3-1646(+)